jgi:hypothetical protein
VKRTAGKRPHGQLRRGQVVTTFGPGSMVDLPNHSVLVAGLDHWLSQGEEIAEPRLVEKLKQLLNAPALKLIAPPPDREDPHAPPTGITAWQFPEWFIAQDVESGGGGATRSRPLVNRRALRRGRFIDQNKKSRAVVPVRFVRACPKGHIGDIDWCGFVHGGGSDCRRPLWMEERGTSGDLAEVWVRCECGKARTVGDAAVLQMRALGTCDGARPWLGPFTAEPCGEPNRLLIRTASNAYFPQHLSAISLPDRDETVKKAVEAAWDFLESAESADDVKSERRKAKVKAALDGFTDEEVFAAVRARRGLGGDDAKSIRQAELETLIAGRDELGDDRPDGTFHARVLPGGCERPGMERFERVVLVHRLREVVAQVGFTRFEPAGPDISGELDMGVQSAALAREPAWLPAVENKGEGVFLQFRTDEVERWLARADVQARARRLHRGFECWQAEHRGSKRKFPKSGVAYILLHTFAHRLITTLSLECGYPSSAIRERIYAVEAVGYGVLLHTGTSDSEGTLGGLVEVGRRIDGLIASALESARLCSNDPVCAQHAPEDAHARRFLQGAACHGCTLIAETCCEQQNDFLDRALLVATVDDLGVEFFADEP